MKRRRMLQRALIAGLALLCLLIALPAAAHKESDAYVTLRSDPDNAHVLRGQWDIALRDLNFAMGIDSNSDGAITWGEVKAHRQAIERYALARLAITGDGLECPLTATGQQIDNHTDGAYDVIRFKAVCDKDIPNVLSLHYRLFADVDPYHRGIITVHAHGRTAGAVLGPGNQSARVNLRKPNRWRQFKSFVYDGMWHIWLGLDHMMFILSLLLPSVLIWRVTAKTNRWRPGAAGGEWLPVDRLWPAFVEIVKVVSAFTVSHSVTLTLAVLGIVELPSRLVESGIALSIIVAALNNIYPIINRRVWLLAFGFGFIHGLGFASALSGLDLPAGAMAASLGGFNVGVEIGQEAVVLAFMPIAFLLRATRFYRLGVVRIGSAIIILISTCWLIERALDVSIPVFNAILPN